MDRRPVCARPGCTGEPVAYLTYDYAGQQVWLEDTPPERANPWGLCADHAGRLRPPEGWILIDRRVARPAGAGGGTAGPSGGPAGGGPAPAPYEPPVSLAS